MHRTVVDEALDPWVFTIVSPYPLSLKHGLNYSNRITRLKSYSNLFSRLCFQTTGTEHLAWYVKIGSSVQKCIQQCFFIRFVLKTWLEHRHPCWFTCPDIDASFDLSCSTIALLMYVVLRSNRLLKMFSTVSLYIF